MYKYINNPITTRLGEGIFYDKLSRYLFWLDINNSHLFFDNGKQIRCYELCEEASAIMSVKNENIFLASRSGIVCFNLNSQKIIYISKNPKRYLNSLYRTNDALMLSENVYMYGVMKKDPIKSDGALILSKNGISNIVYTGVAIPNTFIKIPHKTSLLISDSLEKIVYKFNFTPSWDHVVGKEKWLDLKDTNSAPDGGCISSDGRIFIAIWDGFKVIELDLDGNIVNEFNVPVPRPTDCALNLEENKLFVTSAYEGLSNSDREDFPLSGSIITIDVGRINVS